MQFLFGFHWTLCVKLAELLLLRRHLDHQALAQVPRSHAGRVKMLHQVDRVAHQLKRRGQIVMAVSAGLLAHCDLAQGRGQLFLGCCQVAVFIQVANHQLGCCVSRRAQA